MKQTKPQAITEFRKAAAQPIRYTPTVNVSFAERKLAVALIQEELDELAEALAVGRNSEGEYYDKWEIDGIEPDIIATADALGDLDVVVQQGGPAFGINLDAVFEEVHRSNMSKVDPETGKMPRRADGKAMKGPNFFQPDLERVLLESPFGMDVEKAADPSVDIVLAPSVARGRQVIPVEFPTLHTLPIVTPMDIGRGLLSGRVLRDVYLLPGVDAPPTDWDSISTELVHCQAMSNLGGGFFDLKR